MGIDRWSSDTFSPLICQSRCKKRKVALNSTVSVSASQVLCGFDASIPSLQSYDYFMNPSESYIANRELIDPGYCSRIQDFTVGRVGYGCVKFKGETDVRWLDLDHIIRFSRNEIVVYEDESSKPLVGQGLNKAAEVTLVLQIRSYPSSQENGPSKFVNKLRLHTARQGADFISFNPSNGEWKFSVHHFSRFGLTEDDEEDIIMDDAAPEVEDPEVINGGEFSGIDQETAVMDQDLLSHSLPAHLGLDPVKMREMRMLMFPVEDEEAELNHVILHQKHPFHKESTQSPVHQSSRRAVHRFSPPVVRKTPLALLEYNPSNFGSSSPGSILMSQQNKGLSLKPTKLDGFKLDIKHDTPVTGSHSRNIVDAALFMGRSFRVGWGPNGILVHTGAPVGSSGLRVMSSVVNLEKVAFDKVVRDEDNKISEDLVDLCFDSPLNFHKELNHETNEVAVGTYKLNFQKLVCDPLLLPDTCRSYIEIIEGQLEVPRLTSSARVVLMHQVLVWELIKVLFSKKEMSVRSIRAGADDGEDAVNDGKESFQDIGEDALQLVRRAEFSYWLQESVCHRVQDEVSSLDESNDLKHVFLLLTGRQLDAAVELSASRGDVRLACLLSQAGGSTVIRSDICRQLEIWRVNGLDFNFIEEDRVRLLELLAGNIHEALHDINIDWKRFLGLLMWYKLPPDTPLPIIFQIYQKLLHNGRAPYPVPVYIDEGPVEEGMSWSPEERFDLAYYLMLLHASDESKFSVLKRMFSAFASTKDPLDYHMIWHQRAILEAIGIFSSTDLHILDMGLVSQLLSLGKCHWAIYVVLHMPHRSDYPYLQATLIREILFQYCETWSTQDLQRQFIEELGIPPAWLDEALAVYFTYYGDSVKALEHFLQCANWQKAHSIFMTSVAHSLYLSARHSEIWEYVTLMEEHKSEVEDWELGAGIYLSYNLLKSSLQEDNDTMNEMNALESKNNDCRDFLGRLKESLAKYGSRLPVEGRVAYSKMAEEVCNLLVADSGENSTCDIQLSCFDTVFSAPIPENLQSSHLQDAVSVFTCYLSEVAS